MNDALTFGALSFSSLLTMVNPLGAVPTFLAVTREMSAFKRWALRSQVMLLIGLQFWYSNFQRMADFFRRHLGRPTRR